MTKNTVQKPLRHQRYMHIDLDAVYYTCCISHDIQRYMYKTKQLQYVIRKEFLRLFKNQYANKNLSKKPFRRIYVFMSAVNKKERKKISTVTLCMCLDLNTESNPVFFYP